MKLSTWGTIVLTPMILLAFGFLMCNLIPSDIDDKAKELEAYCCRNGYNTDYAILVDFSRHSLQRRLYVYDFNKDKVIMRSLCAHGLGGESNIFRGDFSNRPGSNCSSLGHYRVGRNRKMYNHPKIPAFELHGLNGSNSNSLSRGILIHPHVGPLTRGCFGMPVINYHRLSVRLRAMPHNIILWAYE